jgi:hypothetical protein
MQSLFRIVFFLVSLSFCAMANGEAWRTVEVTDSMTDTKTVVAETKLPSGHAFALLRRSDGAVWAMLSLPEGKFDIFGQRRPQFRIDANKAHDLEDSRAVEKYLKQPVFRHEPTTIGWQIFADSGPVYRGTLCEIMDGKLLTIRYYRFPEGSAELTFGLNGAKSVIAKALQIPEDVDPKAAEADAAYRAAFASGGKKCIAENRANRAGYEICIAQLKANLRSLGN